MNSISTLTWTTSRENVPNTASVFFQSADFSLSTTKITRENLEYS